MGERVDMKRKMFEGELVLATWEDLTLTTHRVWQLTQGSGAIELSSFAVDEIQCVRFG